MKLIKNSFIKVLFISNFVDSAILYCHTFKIINI